MSYQSHHCCSSNSKPTAAMSADPPLRSLSLESAASRNEAYDNGDTHWQSGGRTKSASPTATSYASFRSSSTSYNYDSSHKQTRMATLSLASALSFASSTCVWLKWWSASSSSSILPPPFLLGVIFVWFSLGVLAICTTKLLVEQGIPPLVLTVQQFLLSSTILRLYLGSRNQIQPMPMATLSLKGRSGQMLSKVLSLFSTKGTRDSGGGGQLGSSDPSIPLAASEIDGDHEASPKDGSIGTHTILLPDLILCGLFNCLDFLASNTSFSQAAASFVETVKASEPLTTTAIALAFGFDRLHRKREEGISLCVLILGVMLATLGNSSSSSDEETVDVQQQHNLRMHRMLAEEESEVGVGNVQDSMVTTLATIVVNAATEVMAVAVQEQTPVEVENTPPLVQQQQQQEGGDSVDDAAAALRLRHSIKTCLIVMTANLCFAFRAKCQKAVRAHHPEGQSLNDVNLLMRMQQIGWLALLVPCLVFESTGVLARSLAMTTADFQHYALLSFLNAIGFVSYNLASCYVLTQLSVVQHTGWNCLRRLFVTLWTAIAFGVPITPMGGLGILLCSGGFASFSHFRNSGSTGNGKGYVPASPHES